MTPRQLGVLVELFDQIRTKIETGTLEYGFVKNSLGEILDGPRVQLAAGNRLSVMGTFDVSSEVKRKMLFVEEVYGRRRFQGYGTNMRLGEFFCGESPATPGGIGAVLVSDHGLTILDFIAEVFEDNTENTDWNKIEERIFRLGLSFSMKQVMDILENGVVDDIVGTKKRTLVFLVHNNSAQIGAVTTSRDHKGLFGKDLDTKYTFKSAAFIVRSAPSHIRTKQ